MKPQTTVRARHAIDLNSHRLLKRLQTENTELRNKANTLMLEIEALRSVKAQPARSTRNGVQKGEVEEISTNKNTKRLIAFLCCKPHRPAPPHVSRTSGGRRAFGATIEQRLFYVRRDGSFGGWYVLNGHTRRRASKTFTTRAAAEARRAKLQLKSFNSCCQGRPVRGSLAAGRWWCRKGETRAVPEPKRR
jgi:hypothetical protein